MIICIGDSNTYGFDPCGYFGGRYDEAWPEILTGLTGYMTVNLGENGREIPHGLRSIETMDALILKELPADYFTILLGGNDIANLPDHSPDTAAVRMEGFLRHLKERFPEVKQILITLPEVRVGNSEIEEAHRALNRKYRALAAEMKVQLIDAESWDIPLAFDGVHYTEEGHRIFAEHMAAALKALIYSDFQYDKILNFKSDEVSE